MDYELVAILIVPVFLGALFLAGRKENGGWFRRAAPAIAGLTWAASMTRLTALQSLLAALGFCQQNWRMQFSAVPSGTWAAFLTATPF